MYGVFFNNDAASDAHRRPILLLVDQPIHVHSQHAGESQGGFGAGLSPFREVITDCPWRDLGAFGDDVFPLVLCELGEFFGECHKGLVVKNERIITQYRCLSSIKYHSRIYPRHLAWDSLTLLLRIG